MSNLFNPTEIKNKPHREAFDLSKKLSFTAKCGELLPIYQREVLPGDKWEFDIKAITRTRPIKTPAFCRMKQYFDAYFVPFRLLWRFAPQWFTQMHNNVQSVQQAGVVPQLDDYLPYVSAKDYISNRAKLFTTPGVGGSVSVTPTLVSKALDIADMPVFGQQRKLMEYLGYAPLYQYEQASDLSSDFAVNLFPAAAYQKIYSDYFRNTQWEKSNPASFNLDFSLGGQVPMTSLRDSHMFDMRYCDLRKDMITGVLPKSQYGAVSTVETGSIEFSKLFDYSSKNPPGLALSLMRAGSDTGSGQAYIDNSAQYDVKIAREGASSTTVKPFFDGANQKYLIDYLNSISTTAKAVQSSFSVLELRKAQAVQKFREIQLSNEQDYPSQVEAMFGVKVSKVLSGICQYLGGYSDTIGINEVVNTNLAEETSEANLSGLGYKQANSKFSFEAHEHGIIMVIYHVLPHHEYSMPRLEFLNQKVTFDRFAQPVFDKLGYEPMFLGYFDPSYSVQQYSQPYGYNPRYIEYKTDIDEVKGDFASYAGGTMLDWNIPFIDKGSDNFPGSLVPIGDNPTYVNFKCRPSIIDPIFAVASKPVFGNLVSNYLSLSNVSTDQFLLTALFDVKVVRNLDRDGMPY